ncbi:MAG: DUF4407 domain-containing protein [Bacteroidales bacterium]|nr:DUF4407 domain-containing protein [Lachnoclostridium sp.]MCM1385140.1 DUF4407 domain-containing protein [Lachnoclostridium sp.]MCM1465542.1 DUF4407 domain-containing protein [Bacteroidales bacterium]
MEKNLLKQYEDMKKEKEDTLRRIKETQSQLEKLNSKYHVGDCVSGGMGGTEHFKVRGFPYPEYDRKRTLLMQRQLRLDKLNKKLDEKLDEVERYIETVEDSRKRLILKLRYIDGLTWKQTAKRLGPGNQANSVRMEIERFMENH